MTDREISEFLLRACHDAKASVRAVRAHSELLLRQAPPDPALAQRIAYIVEGAAGIDSLVEGLARYSVALQTDPAAFQSVSMAPLLRTVLAKLSRELLAAEAEVTYGDLPRVSGNPDRLMQLLENLLRNALVHRGAAPPRIHIAADQHAEGWLFTVRDNGPGIDAASLETIFAPWERLHGNERKGPGLGLTACRVIVERHGGRIWAESPPEGGATFHFILPPSEPRP